MAIGSKGQKDLLISWLNDAYSMENGLIPVLRDHANDFRDMVEVKSRLEHHAEETQEHANMVKGCIERLGGDVSSLKSAVGTIMGHVSGMSNKMFGDKEIKDTLSDFSSEHMEIASYKALITAAREYGDIETANICERILASEEDMASWLDDHLPKIVQHTFTIQAS